MNALRLRHAFGARYLGRLATTPADRPVDPLAALDEAIADVSPAPSPIRYALFENGRTVCWGVTLAVLMDEVEFRTATLFGPVETTFTVRRVGE